MGNEVVDTVGMRDPIRCIQRIENMVRDRRKFEGEDLNSLREAIEELTNALNSLDLVVEVQGGQDRLACRLLSIGQAFARGEGMETDEDGFLKLGDVATELADELYAYATEG